MLHIHLARFSTHSLAFDFSSSAVTEGSCACTVKVEASLAEPLEVVHQPSLVVVLPETRHARSVWPVMGPHCLSRSKARPARETRKRLWKRRSISSQRCSVALRRPCSSSDAFSLLFHSCGIGFASSDGMPRIHSRWLLCIHSTSLTTMLSHSSVKWMILIRIRGAWLFSPRKYLSLSMGIFLAACRTLGARLVSSWEALFLSTGRE